MRDRFPSRGWVHVRVFPRGFKGQNESRRELQNGSGLGPSEGAHKFDWYVGGGGRILPVSGGFDQRI